MELIVTGTGRCGTGYMAKVLTGAGFPCGHEQMFTARGAWRHPSIRADSSWMAVPYLEMYPNVPVILVYRHPAAVISSFMGISFFELRSDYRDLLYRMFPEMIEMSPFEASCHHYVLWNSIAIQYAAIVTNIDTIAWERIIRIVPGLTTAGLASAIPTVSQAYNHRQRANIDTDTIPQSVWDVWENLENASHAS